MLRLKIKILFWDMVFLKSKIYIFKLVNLELMFMNILWFEIIGSMIVGGLLGWIPGPKLYACENQARNATSETSIDSF